jgi:two-component system cell cycle sensor histidine kinase/response regulator CckA
VNILIVDDSVTIRDRLREMLSILPGVDRVDTAATASDARQCLEAAPPDVVVLDIHLPGGSGIEVLDALRPARDRVTVIVLTNDPTPQGRDTCHRSGADFFFDKSAEFQRSVDIIAGLARSRTAPRDHLPPCWACFDRLPIPTWVFDIDTLAFETVNDAAVRRYGYSREEFLAMTVTDIWSPEDVPVLMERIGRRRAGATVPSTGTRRHRAKDGSIVHAEIAETPFDRPGQRLDLVLAYDIGDRIVTGEALRASEARYRELFDNATDAIFTTDLDLNVTALNGAAAALTGYTREEARELNIASLVTAETLEQVQRKLTDQLAGKGPSLYETEILARDGRRVPIEVIARLVSREGKPVGIQGIARDISDRKRLEQGLLQAHKMEAVGRLAGGIAHDFNNLLTVIVGYSQDIIERLPQDDPTHADAVQIFNAGGYAVDLTRQLLAFSRKQILAPKILDLNAVIGQLALMLRRLIGANVELVIRAAQDLGAVKADPGQLEQVIVNLVVNARDAMPHGGTLTVETSTAVLDASAAERPGLVQGHYVLLAISDTGSGMDPLTRAQIFEPFFTTKEAGKGTGLGLCTVYGIVKQSGGYIFAESEPGQGTTFRLYFPRCPAGEIEPALKLPAVSRVEGGTESILLVDDDGGVREFVDRVLAARGYAVLSASSTDEALQLCDGHPGGIDLLLTDVAMSGMTGPALADALRARYPGIKVVYMSGHATDAIDQGALDPLAFIAKPFTARDLMSKIRGALDANKPDRL